MFLGIDIGTQGVKTLLYDAQQRAVVAVDSAPLELLSGADGAREQQAQWWIAALAQCMQRMDKGQKKQVVAIGVSGQQHGFVPLAADGSVLSAVKLWCDTSTAGECAEIMEHCGGEQRVRDLAGNAILPGYTASKILWFKKNHPALYRQLATILLPHDYLNYHLTGELAMEWGDASGTGLLDVRSRQWCSEVLGAIDADRDLGACLPPMQAPGVAMGQLRAQVASEWGLPVGIPVASGGGDNMLAAIGTGNVVPGRMTVSLGTSGTLFAFSDVPVVDPQGDIAAFCSSTGGWLPLLCTMNCTVATELTRGLLDHSVEQLEQRVSNAGIGAGGLVTLPFFNGERTPNLPRGKACILGLDTENYTPANLLRSAMESATFGLRAGLDAFERLGCGVSEIRLTGGGAHSASWRQMVADVFALPVTVLAVDEGAAMGAALQALWMHSGEQLPQLVDSHLQADPARSCRPNAAAVEQYRTHYLRYQQHVEHIAPLYT